MTSPTPDDRKVCAADRCPHRIPPQFAMCPEHWSHVPDAIRRRIARHYTTGQQKHGASLGYTVALEAAVRHIARLERHTTIIEPGAVATTTAQADGA